MVKQIMISIPFKYLVPDGTFKKTGLISFSGGETSGFMLWWLLKNKINEYNFKIVFANTGRENNETLDFVKKCGEYFGVEIIWIESNVWGRVNKGTKHRIVNYETATRNQDWRKRDNTPFEEMVKKYGLANISSKFSTRELKNKPIHSYMRSLGFKNGSYDTFIGIRSDEFDRMSEEKEKLHFIYPLVKWIYFTKKHVNFWWSQMQFRLNLKGWEGNCVTCYKKADEKLIQIMVDDAWKFDFDEYLERKYEYFVSLNRQIELAKKGKKAKTPIRIFRENKTVRDLRLLAKKHKKQIANDSLDMNFQQKLFEESESCEVFTKC